MDSTRAILIDLLNFLESVESRIISNTINFKDGVQTNNLKHCFNTMDSMLKQCENSLSPKDLKKVTDRINVLRDLVDDTEIPQISRETEQKYCDLYLIEMYGNKGCQHQLYGRHLGISNEEFDKLVEEWAQDLDTSQKGPRNRNINKVENFQEQIKGELAQLADTMKSKAIRYRDILVKDNKALLKFTGEQEKQLDTVTHVAKESSKLSKSATLSLRQIIFMVLSMFGLTILIMFVFLIT